MHTDKKNDSEFLFLIGVYRWLICILKDERKLNHRCTRMHTDKAELLFQSAFICVHLRLIEIRTLGSLVLTQG